MSNLNSKINGRVTISPIHYVMIYLIFTQVVYIAMYHDQHSNMITTILYTSINYFALYMGFFPSWKINTNLKSYNYSKSIERVIVFCSIFTIIISLYNVFVFYSDMSIIKQFITNPGQAYEYVKFIKRNSEIQSATIWKSMVGIVLNVFTFTKYLLGGFSVMYWENISKKYKWLVLFSVMIYMAHSFLIGAMVNIGSFFLSIFPFLLFKLKGRNNKKTWRGKLLLVALTIVAVLLIIYFLGTREVFKLDYKDTGIMLSGLLGVLFYVSHGYVGLSYCLNLPFEFTWGHTIFRGIAGTMLPYIGVDNLFINSYLVRNEMQNGWSALQVWSTVFPWLASDVTFWSIPIVMFIIGYSMKKSWKISVIFENPYALAFLGQLFIFCFMIPANNQLFNTFGNSMGTLIIFMFYVNSLHQKLSMKKK